jgi:N-acetylmuramoyl-L-alanine amidase
MALVVVQRGHVPRTSGATGAPGEQQFARDTAAKLAPLLKAMGHNVRVIDADVPLSYYRGDLFVAIHYDSGASSASGASVGYQSSEGGKFAAAWKRAYVEAGWTRGFRADNYTANLGGYYGVSNAIRQGNRMAIITESGFHSNAGDKALMTPERTARSIAAAVAELTNRTIPEDDMQLSDRVKLTDKQSQYFNGLESISVKGLLVYGAMGGWKGPGVAEDVDDILREVLEAEKRDLEA